MTETIGERIRKKRNEKGFTLAELGEKVGAGASTVRKWETGLIRDMKTDKIKRVAEALDVTPTYLLGLEDSGNADVAQDKSGLHVNNALQVNNSLLLNSTINESPIGSNQRSVNIESLTKEETEIIRIYRELDVLKRFAVLDILIKFGKEAHLI
jgi:transcriptional regulator with XRE-family HTH domain